jgi:endonuclease YncB( thermonuclease family)
MFLSTRALLHPARGGIAMVLAGVFVFGLAAGSMIGPVSSGRTAAANTPPPADAGAAPPVSERPLPVRQVHPVQVVRIVDGDTFDARVNVWPGVEINTRVRLRGIDAPEVRARCQDEHGRAQAAHDALARILAEGSVGIFGVTLDKYGGRVLAEASTRRTPDVSAALLQAGLVRRYAGGRREHWC